ncbi:P-loop containing nucleoside triphosphate hydrolase protein [Gamsiella multidivaricata]|uniref:P-loop containing nucleoside triphosphate hydrolase protein n=1 Tax=Gamsiella multidivaricata TaxID=101098 RepID=UPI00222104DC|nr:P-loop containing nucleoside triphosphate hydrolase protein [Gamsiella multidivaricata]KAI7818261.1 P-loop containing nucleoside triphosphate hydrolase protein [Gamsiella multidivaricata]
MQRPTYGPVNILPPSGSVSTTTRPQKAGDPPYHYNRPRTPYFSTRIVANITGYVELPRVAAMSVQDVKNLRDAHQIYVQGKQIPKPVLSFDDCRLPSIMHANLIENGYIQPRGAQMQVVPAGLCGRDMIVSAETGAGKTAGFLIPVLTHAYGLSQLPGEAMEGPYALVLTPTRELAIQIEEIIKSMVKGMPNMRTASLIGGQAMANQVHRLKQNIQVAIATPGRLVDILARHGEISFSNVFCLVLDEVDLMFSMGFRKQVVRILNVLPEPPSGRQTIMCSATISKQIEQFTAKLLHNAINIRIGDIKKKVLKDDQSCARISSVFSPSSQIKQTILWVENASKMKQLLSLLHDPTYFRPPVLIFVESRVGAELLAHAIQVKCPSITAVSMHGDRSHDERSAIIKSILDGTVPVVVATGLLARGLDLKVATVINFDMAPSIQEYVHRVGRANPDAATKAAAGIRRGPKLGGMAWAITFINNDHYSLLGEFANMLHGLAFEQVTPLPIQLKQLVVATPPMQNSGQTSSRSAQKGPGAAKTFKSTPPKRKANSSQCQQGQHRYSGQRGKKRKRA